MVPFVSISCPLSFQVVNSTRERVPRYSFRLHYFTTPSSRSGEPSEIVVFPSFVAALRLATRHHIRGSTPNAYVDARVLPAVSQGGRSATWVGKINILPAPE